MPRGDRTGPMEKGSMTGRGMGSCAGFAAPDYANPAGYGCGLGRGRGFRRMFYTTGLPRWARFGFPNRAYFASDTDEKDFLKRQAELLESQLNDVKKRIEEIED